MRKVLLVALVVAVVAVVLWRAAGRTGREGRGRLGESSAQGPAFAAEPDAPSLPAEVPPALAAAADVQSEPAPREALPLRPLAGVLRGLAAEPRALLSWTPLLPEFEQVRSINAVDFERLRAVSVTAACDERGRFECASVPEGAASGPSVVWITVPGREARAVPLAAPEAGWSWPELEPLAERAPARVIVLRADQPVAGAHVRHTISFWEAGPTQSEQDQRRVFMRDLRTDEDGVALLAPASGANVLLATDGVERSLLWTGTPEGEIVLELLPTIQVAGRVRCDDPALDLAQLRYHVGYSSAEDDSDFVWAGSSLAVRADGTLGPDTWARAERTTLEAHLVGGEVITSVARVANPPPGGRAFLELEAKRGHPFQVLVQSPEETPIQGAAVEGYYSSGEEWRQALPCPSDETGRATVFAPQGQLVLKIGKPGFTNLDIQDDRLIVPQAQAPFRVVLRPAGTVQGFVRRGTEPVRSFGIVAWNEAKTYRPVLAFEDEEGVFRLEDVPKGETIHLYAYSETLPESETTTFVLADEALELELELPAPRKARGRVIDTLTGEPVAAAVIQHVISGKENFRGYRGRPMAVQADGSFELGGFFPGRGGFAVFADGYEQLFYHVRDDDVEILDVGLVALSPLAALELVVRDGDVRDFGAYHAWNRWSHEYAPTPLGSDGTLTLPSRTGHFELFVSRPDGSVASEVGEIMPGERKRVELEFASGIELLVTLAEPPHGIEGHTLRACLRTRDVDRSVKARWSSERAGFVLQRLQAGLVALELRDGEERLVIQRSVELTDSAQQTLALALGGERRRLRLLDVRGRPWSSCTVHVGLDEPHGWSEVLMTDAAGELVLGPLEAGRVVLSTKIGGESLAYGVPVDLEPDRARTTEVVLDVGPRSLLRLQELGRPVAGMNVLYTHALAPRHLTFGYSSEADGLVRGPFLGPGTYTLVVCHQSFWPSRFPIASRATSEPLPLELFSRATLELEVVDLGGRPLPDARFDLWHAELDARVEDWLTTGWFPAPADLVTDREGKLTLDGIPRGRYAWTCTAASGATAVGEVLLAPRERRTLEIRVREE
jgi:hypothetical protein